MNERLRQLAETYLRAGQDDPQQAAIIRRELEMPAEHPPLACTVNHGLPPVRNLYQAADLTDWQDLRLLDNGLAVAGLRSLDELLQRDRRREEDGFPRKIRLGRMIKPGKRGKEKVVVVPTTVEEKFIHDPRFSADGDSEPSGGVGEGEEGDVIGERPVQPQQGEGTGSGQGEGGQHELESSAYDLGRILTESFQLPNLQEKGKRRSLTRTTYELTDRNRGFGQVLDKKATLRQVVKTNIGLQRIRTTEDMSDPSRFLISPTDGVYRTLSPEKDFESQAMVFFVRDYSGSMAGKSTELVVTQHLLVYSWLLYQYDRQVESRFILHDTDAREVADFYTYHNSKVAGGTQVSAAYKLVNDIVERENLVADYNIYVFHGTDGDDWDTEGKQAIPELQRILGYANRVGITIAEHSYTSHHNTQVERYLKGSGLIEARKNLLRLDVLQENADETRLIAGIRSLIS